MEENVSNFTIYGKDTFLIIKNNKTLNIKDYSLQININDLSLNIAENKENLGKKICDCMGVIGVIILEDETYLIVITKALLICTISKKEIYKVLDTNFIKLTDDFDEEADDKSEGSNDDYFNNNDLEIINELKDKFKNGFYFSNGYDLANSLTSQNQIKKFFALEKKLISDYDCIAEGNKNFLANFKLTSQLLSLTEKKMKYFFSNCIYGNIEAFSFEKEKLEIILISRRYLWNYGIFNYRKGLSKYGGNSNQIETEIILIYDHKDIYSNIHLSSYLPIYFKNKKYTEMNMANKGFIKYFKTLNDEYNFLFLFAIKSEDKDDKYITKFKTMLRQNVKSIGNKWKYYYINTKEDKTIKDTIQKNPKDIIDFIGFNSLKDHILGEPIKNQAGIISLLSMDNKSLTQNQLNLIYLELYHMISDLASQGKIENFLEKDINLNFVKDEINEIKEEGVDKEQKSENEINEDTNIKSSDLLIKQLKKMLINKEKELSSQYYTKYGFDLNKKNQRIYEILFGKNTTFSPLKSNLNEHKEEFSEIEKIKLYVATWNTSSTEFSKIGQKNLDSLLLPKDPKIIPDIYCIGFQEVVKLTATNIIMIGEEKLQQILNEWNKKILESIQKIGKYKKLVIMNLVGINFFSYILEDKYDKVKSISKKIVKTGFGGTTGNKGSCIINFEYENTSFSISCSHLVANKKNKRLKELEYILNLKLNTFYNPEKLKDKTNDQLESISQSLEEIMSSEEETRSSQNSNNLNNTTNNSSSNNLAKSDTLSNTNNTNNTNNEDLLFKDSDIWILFGDLNFRIDMEYEEFSDFIKKGNSWDKLLEYDQFVKYQLASLSSNTNIKEDVIKFAPTYKYIINSDEFDYTPSNKDQNLNQKEKEKENENNLHKSGKKRNPSWCDRIFYKKNSYMTKDGKKIITGLEYNSVMDKNFQTSDHRPVYEIFEAIIFKENPEKKELIEKEIISNENLGISNKYMKQKIYDF